jgi:hypothetical protein
MTNKKIIGQFVPHTLEMLQSPAWCVLSLSAYRILDRIEIELCRHRGQDNGKLPVTYQDFVRYGIDRHAIAPGLRELQALGLLEITQQGMAGNADMRRPHLFRLTYLRTDQAPATNNWQSMTTLRQAKTAVAKARADKSSDQSQKSKQHRGNSQQQAQVIQLKNGRE